MRGRRRGCGWGAEDGVEVGGGLRWDVFGGWREWQKEEQNNWTNDEKRGVLKKGK